MSGRDKEYYSIQSVENALRILEAIGDAGGEIRIAQLSATLGMAKGKVFRLLATFEAMGYVEQARTGKYRLGLPAYAMGQKLLSGMDLLQEARPFMAQLAREFDEAVYLAVPEGQDVLLLDMVNTTRKVAIISLLGSCRRLDQAAAGKVILAYQNGQGDAEAELAVDELSRIRRQGVCRDRDALGEGIASLAVPLLQEQEVACGSLCLVLPEFRLAEDQLHTHFIPRMQKAGALLSRRLGYIGRPQLSAVHA